MVLAIKTLSIYLTLFLSSLLVVNAGMEEDILALVNKERTSRGCHGLTLDSRLIRVAQLHNDFCVNNNILTHDDPAGSLGTRFNNQGYQFSAAGENIAEGFDDNDCKGVMNAWMNSPGHRANILNPQFHHLGVACGHGFWTQDFGSTLDGSNDSSDSSVSSDDTQGKPKKKVVKFGKKPDPKTRHNKHFRADCD